MGSGEFKWDGSDLGIIDEHINGYQITNGYLLIHFKSGEIGYANRFDTTIPLIADELKPLFGLSKIGRHQCRINGVPVLLSRKVGTEDIFSAGIATPDLLLHIQRAYLFRWALGLTYNVDKMLWYRVYKSGVTMVTSYRENKVDYANDNPLGARICGTVLRRWFKDWDQVNNVIQQLFGHRSIMDIRFAIDRIVRRIDPRRVAWICCIVGRIMQRLD